MSDVVLLDEAPLAPPSWKQLGVLVMDGSVSMTWDLAEPDTSMESALPARTKAAAVDIAVRDLLNRLAAGSKAANFHFGFVSFNDHVTSKRSPQELLSISTADNFDPTAAGTGGTEISTGIEAATQLVETFLRDGGGDDVPVSAIVLVMSDGEDASPAKTLAAAQRLKEIPNAQLAACLFATKGRTASGAQLLQSIVSAPHYYQTVFTAEQLRDFFHASMTMAAIAATSVGDAAQLV